MDILYTYSHSKGMHFNFHHRFFDQECPVLSHTFDVPGPLYRLVGLHATLMARLSPSDRLPIPLPVGGVWGAMLADVGNSGTTELRASREEDVSVTRSNRLALLLSLK